MSVVLITGANSGIGLATTFHFARLGHQVHAGVRRSATATDLTRAIEKEAFPIGWLRSTWRSART